MHQFLLFIFGITLLKGIAMCKPYITGPTPIICPGNNETLVLTCRDSQIFYLSWSLQPNYGISRFNEKDKITYLANMMEHREDMRGPFTGKLVDIFNVSNSTSGRVADMVSTLTISSKVLLNGTIISCTTRQETDDSELKMSITLIFAEKPSPTTTFVKAGSAMLKSNYHNLIATLFNGTAIDYYNISFSGGEETYSIVNTPGNLSIPTWLHNVTKFNVTAHNCAGQSDPVIVYIFHGCDQPLPPMNGSVDNVTTELGGRITFRCNDGFLPSEVMTAVCQTTGWSQDPALLECLPQEFNSGRQNSHIAIGVIAIPVVVGTAGIFIMVVASIWMYVERAKRKCQKSSHTLENTRSTLADSERPDPQPENSSVVSTYSYVQVPVVKVKPSTPQGSSDFYAVVHGNQHTSQGANVVGMYSEIGDIHGPLSQVIPPPPANDTVTHFHPDLLQCHDTPVPLPTQPPSSERSEPDVDEPVKDLDVHPLDKTINGHIILLQLGSVRTHWRTFGSAVGVDEETLDMINADLTEDSEKLAEVVFRWMEQKTFVTWAEIAHLCKLIGFHELSEALNKAYETGILPVEDDAEVTIPIRGEAEAPPLPPRDDLECDEVGGSPPPPLPPPLSFENLPPYPENGYPGPPPRPKPYIPSTD